VKNTEELEGPNVDLRNKKEETYRCRVAAEVRRIFSGQIWLMQRPELARTRRSAEAELEQQGNSERKKTTEGGEWKRPRSCLFIRKG